MVKNRKRVYEAFWKPEDGLRKYGSPSQNVIFISKKESSRAFSPLTNLSHNNLLPVIPICMSFYALS